MTIEQTFRRFLTILTICLVAVSLPFDSSTFKAYADPWSGYYYRFTVDKDGFTNIEVKFNSTRASGESWVFVPKSTEWSNATLSGKVTSLGFSGTEDIVGTDYPFYQVYRFGFISDGLFSMKIWFNMSTGALILEGRGIFFSPQIGYQQDSYARAEVFLDRNLTLAKARAIGRETTYNPTRVDSHYASFVLPDYLIRVEAEFSTSSLGSETVLKSNNNVFTFRTEEPYERYASSILDLYDRLYDSYTQLFNVTLSNIDVKFFVPDYNTLLDVGGFVPYMPTGEVGTININIFFIRGVNGTIEVIAAHELVHHFLSEAGLRPDEFLWFHEGMAEYVSLNLVQNLGYHGAADEKGRVEQSAANLVQLRQGDLGFVQGWKVGYSPPGDTTSYYVASYYVVSRLPEKVNREGFDYYRSFFRIIHDKDISNINVLVLYLSMAANASVAFTLKNWGFSVVDLYDSPIRDTIDEVEKTLKELNPVFQPYRFLAEHFYRQALISAEQGDWDRAAELLQLAISMATLAPLLTFLTMLGLLVILIYVLRRFAKKILQEPSVPVPPPEIFEYS